MRSCVREVCKEWLALVALLQEAEHTVRKVLCRIERLAGLLLDLEVRDLLRAFDVNGWQYLHRRGVVFQKGLVQVY